MLSQQVNPNWVGRAIRGRAASNYSRDADICRFGFGRIL
jgi:hypothetical protein